MTVGYLIREGVQGPEVFMGRKIATPSSLKLRIAGKIIGYGGKRDVTDPSDVACIVRECETETAVPGKSGIIIEPDDAVPMARFVVKNEDGRSDLILTYFVIKKWTGEANDSKEIVGARFYPINDLPEDVLALDTIVLPAIIAGQKLGGWAKYDAEMSKLVASDVYPVETLEHE